MVAKGGRQVDAWQSVRELPDNFGAGIKMSGSNAFPYGRKVKELRITTDEMRETLEWVEPDYWSTDPYTHQLERKKAGKRRRVVRNTGDYFGAEPFHRWV